MYKEQSATAMRGVSVREEEWADKFVSIYEGAKPVPATAMITIMQNGKTNQVKLVLNTTIAVCMLV